MASKDAPAPDIMNVREIIELAFGDFEKNTVHFKLLQTVLLLLARQLSLLERHVIVEVGPLFVFPSDSTLTVTEVKIHAAQKRKTKKDAAGAKPSVGKAKHGVARAQFDNMTGAGTSAGAVTVAGTGTSAGAVTVAGTGTDAGAGAGTGAATKGKKTGQSTQSSSPDKTSTHRTSSESTTFTDRTTLSAEKSSTGAGAGTGAAAKGKKTGRRKKSSSPDKTSINRTFIENTTSTDKTTSSAEKSTTDKKTLPAKKTSTDKITSTDKRSRAKTTSSPTDKPSIKTTISDRTSMSRTTSSSKDAVGGQKRTDSFEEATKTPTPMASVRSSPYEKILVVQKLPSSKGRLGESVHGSKRTPQISVVTQEQFNKVADRVRELQKKLLPVGTPGFPVYGELMEELRKGASLTDAMAALQLSARLEATEKSLTFLISMVTDLALRTPGVGLDSEMRAYLGISATREKEPGTSEPSGIIEGAPFEGAPTEGDPIEGELFEGAPFEGEPFEGSPFEDDPFEGDPFEGEPFDGALFEVEGAPIEGAPFEGAPFKGEPFEGDPFEGDPSEDGRGAKRDISEDGFGAKRDRSEGDHSAKRLEDVKGGKSLTAPSAEPALAMSETAETEMTRAPPSTGSAPEVADSGTTLVPSNYITFLDLQEGSRQMYNEMIKKLKTITIQTNSTAESAYKLSRKLEAKLDSALHASSRMNDLANAVRQYAEQINALDTGLSSQMTNYQEQLTQMQHDLEIGLDTMAEVLGNCGGDTEGVAELHSHFTGLQVEFENMSFRQKELKRAQNAMTYDLENLWREIEMLRDSKSDREEVADALRDKAGICELNELVSMTQFEAVRGDFQKRIRAAYDKFNTQEFIWQKAIDDTFKELYKKADLIQIYSLKDEIHKYLNRIQDRMQLITDIVGEQRSSMFLKKVFRDTLCLSCGSPAHMDVEEPGKVPTLPKFPSTRRPAEGAETKGGGDYGICYPNLPIPHPCDPRFQICKRYCGGSHTVVTDGLNRALSGLVVQQVTRTSNTAPGTDGKLYLMDEQTKEIPCLACNIPQPSPSSLKPQPQKQDPFDSTRT